MTSGSYERHTGRAADYDVLEPGSNWRLDDLRSAIGLVQLAKLPRFHERRREIWRWYVAALRDSPELAVPFGDRDLAAATPHILPLVLSGDGAPIRQRLALAGVQTSRHYPLLGSLACYRGARGTTPIADSLQLLTLPFGLHLTHDLVLEIADLLRR
jgi:dTDP-4-amino-4,6-dideoxygalactose transaminase